MQQEGIVIKNNGKDIEIAFMREAACGTSCESCPSKCGESKQHTIVVSNENGYKIGDRVIIETDFKDVIGYIFLVYGLPLLLFLIGLMISYYLLAYFSVKNYEILSLAIGILSMALAYFIINKIDKTKGLKNTEKINLKRYK